MTFRARYFLFGGVAIVAAVGLISWHFFGGRGEVLKPDGGPVVTVMDFGQPFSLDPLPSGWRHRKFWTRSPMTMSFAVKDGVPSLRFKPMTALQPKSGSWMIARWRCIGGNYRDGDRNDECGGSPGG